MTLIRFSAFSHIVLLCAIWLVQGATPALGQSMPAYQLASESGAARLLRVSLALERPSGAEQVLADLERRAGFAAAESPTRYLLPPTVSLTPELGHDRNFNGGLGAHTLTLSGRDWSVSPDSQAQPVFYLGARIGLEQRIVWAPGAALSVTASTTYRHAIGRNMDYQAHSLRLCSENQLTARTAVDLCANRVVTKRARGSTQLTAASLGLSHVLQSANALTEVNVSLSREFRPGYARNTGQLNVQRLDRARGVFDASLFLGERVVPHSLATFIASAGHGRFIGDRFFHLRLTHLHETGGQIAGLRNHKHETSIQLRLPRLYGARPTIGLTRQRHDISNFDSKFISFALDFGALSTR